MTRGAKSIASRSDNLTRAAVFALLSALALCIPCRNATAQATEARKVVFDFETGDMQGWVVVEGAFDFIICNKKTFRNRPKVPYNKQGDYFLTTLELRNGQAADRMTGVIESPVFVLEGPEISFLVGGGGHAETYVALCTEDGKEVMHARGKFTETMQRTLWDAKAYVGQRVFMRVVDKHQGGWGHVTLDDFSACGRIDPQATARRADARRALALKKKRADIANSMQPLSRAIEDLAACFGPAYPHGKRFRTRIEELERSAANASVKDLDALVRGFEELRREALIASPLVSGQPILFVLREQYRPDHHNTATMFQNGEINTGSFRGGSALKCIHFGKGGEVRTLLDAPEGVVRDPEVSYDGSKVLFSMRRNRQDDYHVYEIDADGTGLKQLTFGPRVSDIDPAYLPDGRIVFSSTRDPKYCQCNRHIMGNLFVMDADGANMHQVGRNALFEGHPFVLPDGRVLYDRWEYVDRHFGPSFGLWTMAPDGTNHALYYGNNAWSPGGIVDARALPGGQKVVATLTSCHDRPWGAIAIIDRRIGMDGSEPILRSWPADISRFINVRSRGGIDAFKGVRPKYEDPFPLSDRHFLCSRSISGEKMGLFLIDVFGNEVLLHVEGPGCFDPMPIAPRARPPVIPPRVNLSKTEGRFYLFDVYQSTAMAGVKRGAVKYLRIVEAPCKRFFTHTFWNIDAQQAPSMNWNLTNNKRILGDVPVEPDGSAYFSVASDRFIFFQALDADRMMIQSMRSGTTIRPGETTGCVGCHEHRLQSVPPGKLPSALRRPPGSPEQWYGPPRDFNYLTEVQPVFDKYCVRCHDHGKPAGEKLILSGDLGLVFNLSYLELRRKSAVRWFPDKPGAAKVLVKAVDDGPPEVLPAYAWGSHRSRLVDVIRSGHQDLDIDRESIDRIVTWIDLNAVYYGSYASAYPNNVFGRSPLNGAQIRRLRELTGVPVGEIKSEMNGSQVNLTRPELSACLRRFKDKSDPRYREALEIIRAGQQQLQERPRADMPGFRITRPIEQQQLSKHQARTKAEAEARAAIMAGEKHFADRN